MAIRNPRFTGQFNAPDARFNVPTGSVSTRVPTSTKAMKEQNILNVIGGIQKIATDISDRYSASEFQSLTSEFEREKIDLFDKTTSDVNNYNDFATNGMKGHAALVKKYEKLAKEKNINPNYSTRLKTFTLSSGDSFKNSLVSNARRIEPTILNRKAQNQAAQAITNLRGSHPNANPNTRAIGDELMLTLDRFASVIGEERVKTLKRSYLNTAEQAHFQTVVRDNPGFFIKGHENYTGFKFSYTDADDIAKNVAMAKSEDRKIKNEIERNRVKDISNITNGLKQITYSNAAIEISLKTSANNPIGLSDIENKLTKHNELLSTVEQLIINNPDVTPIQRERYLNNIELAKAKILNDTEFLSTVSVLNAQDTVEGITRLKNIFVERGQELEGSLAVDYEKNLSSRLTVFDDAIVRVQENNKINNNIDEIKTSGFDPTNPGHKKAMNSMVASFALSSEFTNNVSQMHPEINTDNLNAMNPLRIMNKTLFKTSTDGNGTLGAGALEIVKLVDLTGELPPSTFKILSNLINAENLGPEFDVKRGSALTFITQLRQNGLIDSKDLEKYDLEIPYKTYGTFVTSSVMDASQIGSSLRSDNEKKATEVLSLTGQAPLTQEEQIQTVYTPVSPDGSTTAGVDLYNTLIVREAGTFDRIGLSLGRMMAYRNAIDGTKSTDNINDILSPEKQEIFNKPTFKRNLFTLHKTLMRPLLKQGKTAKDASKIAALQVAEVYAPSLLSEEPFGLMMPDNPTLNRSENTSFEHGNRLATFIQDQNIKFPQIGMNFDNAFRTGQVTLTSDVSRPNWVFGDEKKVRIDGMKIKVAGKDITLNGNKVFLPYTGDTVMAGNDSKFKRNRQADLYERKRKGILGAFNSVTRFVMENLQ